MKTLRVKVGGVWSEVMTEDMFVQDQRGFEIEGICITEQLSREECIKRYPDQFAKYEKTKVDMNTPDLLEKIRAKVILAVPELAYECDCEATESNPEAVCKNALSNIPCRPIRLADVLLAIDKVVGGYAYAVSEDGHILLQHKVDELGRITFEGTGVYWNLRKDSLEDQSPEVINFISSILGVV